MSSTFTFQTIGHVITPFREKFGIPRQSMMMTEAFSIIKLNPDPNYTAALKNLDQFSHLWIVFVFHKNGSGPWRPLIDTPRVEAGERMGVFATRSPHRPNPIGMSAVRLEKIDFDALGGIEIHVNGVDLLDNTPVLDIKPYVPYADRLEDANSGWIKTDIERHPVAWSDDALVKVAQFTTDGHPRIKALIEEMLALDPRPTSQRRAAPIHEISTEGMKFAFRVLEFDVHWEVKNGVLLVSKVMTL
ncbi:MAG: tRNA (N6-threonylcarbamoyladenosine(37)-N6)-methyltransferase TrmO [Chitinophagaceae bacterium]|nr:tRNA (N6-threonylcarbamoyladenosine(37)-N6)-methyltransferase TrmO [Oligoflexus sp.]